MLLDALQIAHYPKSLEARPLAGRVGAFVFETCQRIVVIGTDLGDEVSFRGAEAYRFLLQISTGLESEVKGETDVFGQLKEAWRVFSAQGSYEADQLEPWMQKLFEDTKDIRSRYLHGIGGASYGSLSRLLLKQRGARAEETILLVGAGKIAKSVGPWLTEHPLVIANRSPEPLAALYRELASRPGARVSVAEDEPEAWKTARHIVLCIPVDAAADARRIAWFSEGGFDGRTVIHLGALRKECGAWLDVPGFHSLDELFALQKQQDDARSEVIARALRACAEKARLRGLPGSPGGSVTLPHGWEDLAVFA